MRDQYAGDVTDYLKFALLRAIVPSGSRLGVAWYYLVGDDGRPDGRHTEYQNEPEWRALDAPLLQELATLNQKRSVAALQRLCIWHPKTRFYDDPVPIRSGREKWAWEMARHLRRCDVVFADPDNGLSPSGIVSRKSATNEEIELLAKGRFAVLIRFPSRQGSHMEQLIAHHKLLGRHDPITIRTCVQVRVKGKVFPRIRWFTLLNASAEARRSAEEFVNRLRSISGAKASMSEDASW